MIASEYLDYRARLDATLGSLAEAARRSGASTGRPALLRNLAGALGDPFLLVVAGESGAGKSMFLNALAGQEFCEPVEGAVGYFKCAEQAREVPGGKGLLEVYRPSDFLRDFHIAEFPGSAAAVDGAAEAAERFVPMADLIVVVISVADAWTPGVWRSLDRVMLGHGKQPVIALTACDLRSDEEIRAVLEHIELTMEKRYSSVLPIFQMSAENAFLARTNPAAGGEAALGESGILEFEEFVSQNLLDNEARLRKFSNALTGAQSVLGELQPPLAETEAILGKDGDLLEGLKQEINERYEKTNIQIRSQFFERLDRDHAAAVGAAQAEFARASGWGSLPGLVFGGGKRSLPGGFGEKFRDRIAAATEARVVDAMTAAESDVGDLWNTLSARVGEEFDHQLSASDGTGKAVWSGRGENLLRRAQACADKACADFSIAAAMGEQLRHGAIILRFFATSAVVLAVAAGVLFGIGLQPSHLLVGGLAIVALGFGAGQFIDGRRKQKKSLAARAEAGRIQLRADLSSELTSHVHEYYTKLGSLFDPVQELCQQQVEEVSPQISAMRELDENVTGLADELAAMRADASDYMKRFAEME